MAQALARLADYETASEELTDICEELEKCRPRICRLCWSARNVCRKVRRRLAVLDAAIELASKALGADPAAP